jgi:fused signal recognition particle receptor
MSLFRKLFARSRPDADAPVAEPVAPAAETPHAADAGPPSAGGWFQRLRSGLSKSSDALGAGIAGVFTRRRLDATTLADLEDMLIGADLGPATAARIARTLGEGRYDREIGLDEVRSILAAEIEKILAPVERSFTFEDARRPFVILVVGVNGSGKTTTIGKLGAIARREGLSVMLAACDTFRAAAIEQLEVWGRRIGASVMTGPAGADAAGLAYDAYVEARARGLDALIIDTAGRLQNRADLMAELEKIIRVLKKIDPAAPHATLLVLDATTGQNALNQVEVFRRMAGITGIVMTKLDGTARGGILVAIAERFGLPVHAVGVGEQADDLQPFEAAAFARAIAGIGEERG